MEMPKVGDRIAIDPLYCNMGLKIRYGTIVRVRGFNWVDVLYDGNTNPSVNIDTRITRPLYEGEK